MNEQTKIEQLKSRMLKKSFYVMFRRVVDRTKLASIMLAHYEWIIGLEKSGKVLASGPLFDPDDGPRVGMTVFRASGFDEAIALAQSDPFCQSGAATFDIMRWQLNEGRIQVSIDLSDQTFQLQ